MALVKGRTCSESCMELLSLELVHYYARQSSIPAAAAIEAIGKRHISKVVKMPCFLPCLSKQNIKANQIIIACTFTSMQYWHAGFRVGRQLAERYTANRGRLGEPLEVIKFICKEFWAAVFRKQVCPDSMHESAECEHLALPTCLRLRARP